MTADARALDTVVGAFVAELARAGVRHVCACPGSRSTPLAIKLAEHPDIKLWMHLDERSAAYFGLGLAKAARQPVVLLATSGTAAANFLPAVVEAFWARVPLVVLTADRPHELRDVGAAQTIDQLRLYGQHVKWFVDLPEPEMGPSPEQVRMVRILAARAAGTALAEPAGPVHLNWPFREPLIPEAQTAASPAVWGARGGGRPYVDVANGRLAPSNALVAALADDLAKSPRGLIVCGPQDDPELPAALARLAQRLGYPILADPLSGLRRGPHERALVLDAYDAFLRHAPTVDQLAPQVMLRFGAMPTSKPVLHYLQRYASARQIVVDPGGWREPTGFASDVLHVDPRLLCQALAAGLRYCAPPGTEYRAPPGTAYCAPPGTAQWTRTWLEINAVTRQAIDRQLDGQAELFEGRIVSASGLPALLPDGTVLYAGNSMPVRDLDTFLPTAAGSLRCLSNRGANGIDGVVSSALGASAAGVGPVALVIGDLSFYHDLNGLLAARQHELDLLVVLVNNDGGGIFSFLPQADLPTDTFETLFGTPHGLDFRPFVEGYGGRFVRVADWTSFQNAVNTGLELGGLCVVEVPTDRARNVALHREVWGAVAEALNSAVAALAR